MTRPVAVVAASLALLAGGCGGGSAEDLAEGDLSAPDRELVAALQADQGDYAAAGRRIAERLEDGALPSRRLRRESEADMALLERLAARLTSEAQRLENDTLRSLAQPAGRYYTRDAATVRGLVVAYVEGDTAAVRRLTARARRDATAFRRGQDRRIAGLRDELSAEQYRQVRTAFEAAAGP